jgi:hypothetical protein
MAGRCGGAGALSMLHEPMLALGHGQATRDQAQAYLSGDTRLERRQNDRVKRGPNGLKCLHFLCRC